MKNNHQQIWKYAGKGGQTKENDANMNNVNNVNDPRSQGNA